MTVSVNYLVLFLDINNGIVIFPVRKSCQIKLEYVSWIIDSNAVLNDFIFGVFEDLTQNPVIEPCSKLRNGVTVVRAIDHGIAHFILS